MKREFLKRYVVMPAAATLLILSAVAMGNAVGPVDIAAMDGQIEVVDGRHVQTLTRQMPFEPGSSLSIRNYDGKIAVSSWDRDELHITAEKRLKRWVGGLGWVMEKLHLSPRPTESVKTYFEQVDVVVSIVDGGIKVETIRPKWSPSVNVSVHYEVKVPRRVDLALRTSNGTIYVADIDGAVSLRSSNGKVVCEGINGPVDATTSNGSVVCRDIAGPIDARTSNGSVTVEHPTALGLRSAISCRTSNGSIRVNLPGECSFEIDARTSNGSIRSAFAVEKSGETNSRKRLAGRVGAGGPVVELRSSNGSISIGRL